MYSLQTLSASFIAMVFRGLRKTERVFAVTVTGYFAAAVALVTAIELLFLR